MKNEQDAREIFLREFTKELILHSVRRIRHARMHAEKPVAIEMEAPVVMQPPVQQKEIPLKQKTLAALPPIEQPAMVPSMMHQLLPPTPVFRPLQQMPMPQPIVTAAQPSKRPMPPQQIPSVNIGAITPQNLKLFGFEKLIQYILDPGVLTIECPGPGRQIVINRVNATEVTNVVLAEEEINNIMRNLSDKTRIPLISGVFKVAFGYFIITAVISGFVGTRFLMQRRAVGAK